MRRQDGGSDFPRFSSLNSPGVRKRSRHFLRIGWSADLNDIAELRRMTLAGVDPLAAAVMLQVSQQGTQQSLPDLAPDHSFEPLRAAVVDAGNQPRNGEHDVPEIRASGAPDEC
jgi:hypothetical protein